LWLDDEAGTELSPTRASRTAAPSEAFPESYRLEKSEIAQFAVAHAGISLTNNGK
jgi:hypothetical protein